MTDAEMTITLHRALQIAGSSLRTGWLMVGVLLLILVGEMGLRLVLTTGDQLMDRLPAGHRISEHTIQRMARADAYQGAACAAWTTDYFKEPEQSTGDLESATGEQRRSAAGANIHLRRLDSMGLGRTRRAILLPRT